MFVSAHDDERPRHAPRSTVGTGCPGGGYLWGGACLEVAYRRAVRGGALEEAGDPCHSAEQADGARGIT